MSAFLSIMLGCALLPNVHILHAHDDIVVVIQKGTVECDNVVGVTAVHDLKLANYTLAHFPLGLNVDDLFWC